METDLNKLRDRAYRCACEHGFHDKEYSDAHFLMLVITEISEAVDADRKGLFSFTKHFTTEKDTQELWSEIEGYEGEYEVSSIGRVRSKNLLVWGGRKYYIKKGRILRPGLSGTGYYTVSLRGKTHKISRLVANAFLCKINDSDCVNHIDGNKENDNVKNLEFISISQNNKHAYLTGLKNSKKQEKLKYGQKVEIAFLHKMGLAYTTIYKNNNYGVSQSCIQRVCNEYIRYTDSVEMELADVVIRLLDFAGLKKVQLDRIILAYVVSPKKSFTENMYAIVKDIVNYKYSTEELVNYAIHQVIRVAEFYKIDIFQHIEWKMKYNESRPMLNGKNY